MRIVKYTTAYKQSIHKWLLKNNHEKPSYLPKYYWVVPGVAALGFYNIEHSDKVIIDSLVTNPLVSSQTRHKAISSLVDFVLNEAASKGAKSAIMFTSSPDTLLRAKRTGFKALQLSVLSKEL